MPTYKVNGPLIKSRKIIYKVDGVLCHKDGDFYSPIPPALMLNIHLAQICEGSDYSPTNKQEKGEELPEG